MKVIAQIRRERLAQLKAETGLSYAEMSARLGRSRRDATLSQIANAAPNTRTGRARQMGDDQARALEAEFKLPPGWFDRDPEQQPGALPPFQVAEAPASYGPRWPFQRISAEQVLALPPGHLQRLEDVLLGALAVLHQEAHPSASATGTTG